MKKKIMIAAAVIILISLLSGCYPSGKESAPNESSSAENIGVYSSTDSGAPDDGEQTVVFPEDLSFEIEPPENIPTELPEITLTLKRWNKADIERIFLDGKEIEEERVSDCDFFPDEKMYVYDTQDQLRVVFEPGRVSFNDKGALGGEFKYGTVRHLGDKLYASDEDLSAFSQEDARSRVEAVLQKLEISNYGEPIIVPITADFANEAMASRDGWYGDDFQYTPWTADEEIYVMYYPLVYEGVELAQNNFPFENKEWAAGGTKITAVVSKNKIVTIEALDVYSESYNSSDKVGINYDFKSALNELKKYYSNLVSQHPTTFTKSKPVYVPYDFIDYSTIICKPAWEFAGYSDWSEVSSSFPPLIDNAEYVYADTGKCVDKAYGG